MFEVDLTEQVPHDDSYGTQEPDWGGPACCQMAMNGYPPNATSCFIDQTTIWNYIQTNNKEGGTGPWGIGWYSDPFAVTKALNDLCPPQHHWVDVSDTNKEEVLFKLLRWMANYKYASLISPHLHDFWELIVYYKTSDDPRQMTNPTLEYIGLYVPYYSEWLGGPTVDYREIAGSAWMEGPYYWGLPCNGLHGTSNTCGQEWYNKWVGIGEPPEEEGQIQVEKITRVGETFIKPEAAAERARKYIKERLRDKSRFLLKYFTGVQDSRPMLVSELSVKSPLKSPEGLPHYYIVPFANKYEVSKFDYPKTKFSVLINAYTGQFEELCVFSRPVSYISEKKAIAIVKKNLDRNYNLQNIQTEFVMTSMQPYVSSALPALRIKLEDKVVFVTQEGLIIGGMYYQTYRGG
ncbi:MAG: hypothetical protein ACFFB5_23630 [Promethearchaeota archaeon]